MQITATEIKRQATRVNEEVNVFYESCNSIIKYLGSMANIAKSEDSVLADKILSYQNSYIAMHGAIKNKFDNLAAVMHKYADDTMKNETETQSQVETLGNEVQNLTEEVNQINSAPEIYVDFN